MDVKKFLWETSPPAILVNNLREEQRVLREATGQEGYRNFMDAGIRVGAEIQARRLLCAGQFMGSALVWSVATATAVATVHEIADFVIN